MLRDLLWPVKCEQNYSLDSVRLCSAFSPCCSEQKPPSSLQHQKTMEDSILPFGFHLSLSVSSTIPEFSKFPRGRTSHVFGDSSSFWYIIPDPYDHSKAHYQWIPSAWSKPNQPAPRIGKGPQRRRWRDHQLTHEELFALWKFSSSSHFYRPVMSLAIWIL